MIARRALLLVACLAAGVAAGCDATQKSGGTGGAGAAAAAAVPPAAQSIADAERARVGALACLHAKGVVELRSRDASGDHFDQGDVDFRWMPGRGVAASISKFGDRWSWIGSDGTRWWAFELKADPVKLRWGRLERERAGIVGALPWLMALRPLVPVPGAEVRMADGRARVRVQAEGAVLPAGAALEADFDPATHAPVAVRVCRGGAVECEAALAELGAVEVEGMTMGTWPVIPLRVRVRGAGDRAGSEIAVFLDRPRADREAVDRAALYDMDGLRAKFAPGAVEGDAP